MTWVKGDRRARSAQSTRGWERSAGPWRRSLSRRPPLELDAVNVWERLRGTPSSRAADRCREQHLAREAMGRYRSLGAPILHLWTLSIPGVQRNSLFRQVKASVVELAIDGETAAPGPGPSHPAKLVDLEWERRSVPFGGPFHRVPGDRDKRQYAGRCKPPFTAGRRTRGRYICDRVAIGWSWTEGEFRPIHLESHCLRPTTRVNSRQAIPAKPGVRRTR